ncbi:MAG TPA: hypothetical protein VLK58_17655, partial [Conexibacter sp.]|nr:hypothetical protein [Conexibacter sp.]
MTRTRIACAAALTLALAPLGAGTASAARRAQGPPPPPKATGGKKVTTIAQGIPTPTQFAFGRGTVFVAGAGAEDGSAPGGVYTLKGGRATRVKGSPRMVFGLAFSGGTLYASSGPTIVAASGWNGKTFTGGFKTIFTAPKGFTGFNGIAIRDGLIYAGVSMAEKGDSKKVDAPFAQSIVTLTTSGRDLTSYATGLR